MPSGVSHGSAGDAPIGAPIVRSMVEKSGMRLMGHPLRSGELTAAAAKGPASEFKGALDWILANYRLCENPRRHPGRSARRSGIGERKSQAMVHTDSGFGCAARKDVSGVFSRI